MERNIYAPYADSYFCQLEVYHIRVGQGMTSSYTRMHLQRIKLSKIYGLCSKNIRYCSFVKNIPSIVMQILHCI